MDHNQLRSQLCDAYEQIGLGLEPDLLIDGRNCCYRAIYANRGDDSGPRYHSLVVMLRFMSTWLDHFMPANVHVFWGRTKGVLVGAGVSCRPTRSVMRPIRWILVRNWSLYRDAAKSVFANLNIRQYDRNNQEADDLIYAACRVINHKPVVVISSDSDFVQLMYHLPNVIVYEPRRNELVSCPAYDPVIQKSLAGDRTDKVGGYDGVGPVRSAALASSIHKRVEFLDQVDKRIYVRNRLLIDLSLCPYLLANIMYVERVLCTSVCYNKPEVLRIAKEYKVNGLLQEYERICSPYKMAGGFDDAYSCPDCGGPQRRCPHGWVCPEGHGCGGPTRRV
jgi:hypothetical protein